MHNRLLSSIFSVITSIFRSRDLVTWAEKTQWDAEFKWFCEQLSDWNVSWTPDLMSAGNGWRPPRGYFLTDAADSSWAFRHAQMKITSLSPKQTEVSHLTAGGFYPPGHHRHLQIGTTSSSSSSATNAFCFFFTEKLKPKANSLLRQTCPNALYGEKYHIWDQ